MICVDDDFKKLQWILNQYLLFLNFHKKHASYILIYSDIVFTSGAIAQVKFL